MKNKFFLEQNETSRKLYIDLLEVTGALSNMFADSKNPFLYYRAMENIFCKSFQADNLSRSDVSADAGKDGLGIGLKTFLQSNGNSFQKVAEFNKDSYLFKELEGIDLIKKVAFMRNERIKSTMRICNLSDMIYHLITRSENYMAIFEEHMDLIDIENITITAINNTTIHFTDGLHDYNFSISKSTLLKRFDTTDKNKIYGFNVEILEDPYDYLLNIRNTNSFYNESKSINAQDIVDFIILPLYSPRSKKVENSSGLNQWNARGRVRDVNEVYIPIPSWIHNVKKNFFSYKTEDYRTGSFNVKLPNGDTLSMKVAQQGGKALMSNPNSALGKWILRDILQLSENELVTKEQLDIIGIDSVKLSKDENGEYHLDFLKSGSYEDFEEEYKRERMKEQLDTIGIDNIKISKYENGEYCLDCLKSGGYEEFEKEDKREKMKVAGFFAGVGGIELGFEQNGFEIVWSNEIDQKASETFKANHSSKIVVDDIKNIDDKDVPDVDIIVGGFPCQAFSVAGYRKGFEDERGEIFFQLARIISKKLPRVIFIENVKNLLSHDNGNTYKVIKETLESYGYFLKAQVLNASEYGNIPQNRERIYIIGFKNKEDCDNFNFPSPIKLEKKIEDIVDFNKKVDDKYYYTEKNCKFYDILKEYIKNRNTLYQWRRVYVRENKSNLCPTLTANMGMGGHNIPLVLTKYGIRKLLPKECFLFQGYPEDFILPKEVAQSKLYKQAGNSVVVPVISRLAKNIMEALKKTDNGIHGGENEKDYRLFNI